MGGFLLVLVGAFLLLVVGGFLLVLVGAFLLLVMEELGSANVKCVCNVISKPNIKTNTTPAAEVKSLVSIIAT
jgi:hypothetical protein